MSLERYKTKENIKVDRERKNKMRPGRKLKVRMRWFRKGKGLVGREERKKAEGRKEKGKRGREIDVEGRGATSGKERNEVENKIISKENIRKE